MRSLLWRLPDRWLAPAPDRARVAWLSTGPYAHRGLHDGATPENSSAAFAAAVARGLGVECDVRLTGDGRAVVFHDERLDRLTGSKGAVADHDWDRLKSLTLRDGGTIPLLRDQVAGKAPLLIELKSRRDRPAAPLCAAVRADLAGYAGQHAVMSFDSRVARWFSRHSPETLRGLVMTEEGARGRRHSAEPDFLAYDIRDLPSCFASAQRQRRLPVLAWTVRTAELRRRANLHADAAIAEAEGLAHPGGNP